MAEFFSFAFDSFVLVAALTTLACFVATFIALLAWMATLKTTLRVHAPLADDVRPSSPEPAPSIQASPVPVPAVVPVPTPAPATESASASQAD